MGGGGPLPHLFFCPNLLVRVKLGYPPNFNFLVHGKKKKKKNNAKFSDHYLRPRTHNVRAHALRLHQNYFLPLKSLPPISKHLPHQL